MTELMLHSSVPIGSIFFLLCHRRPLFRLGGEAMQWRDILLCSVAGLRGSVSLILAQAVVNKVPHNGDPTVLVGALPAHHHCQPQNSPSLCPPKAKITA